MNKKHFIFLTTAVLCINSYSQKTPSNPTMYPGAVPKYPGNTNFCITNDPYEKVIAYYTREKGKPTRVSELNGTNNSAFFQYVEPLPDPGGVTVTLRGNRSRSARRVLNKIHDYVALGLITQERFEEIKNKYEYLGSLYYKHEAGSDGRQLSADEDIFKKYENNIGFSSVGLRTDAEAVAMKAQELIMAGKVEEGMELLSQLRDGAIKDTKKTMSAENVESWIECLEEIAKNGYSVYITITGM